MPSIHSKSTCSIRLVFIAALVCLSLRAQQPQLTGGVLGGMMGRTNSGPTGSVTGTVLAQDTRRPIRFAQVQFQSVTSAASASGDRFAGVGYSGGGGARTEVDGTFTATNLAPGDYYVTASALGYMPERSLLLAAVKNGSDPAQLLAGLPMVRVAADSTSNVTVTLQRGGTLAGRLSWEDGSAAAGVQVTAVSTSATTQLPAPLSGLQFPGFNVFTQTDDRGDFRIAGLPSDDYQLQAVIQSRPQLGGFGGGGGISGVPSTLRVYAPGVFRKSAAKAYSVRAGDERNDVRLAIDLRSLRTVRGHVNSPNAGQNIASGRVSVTDASDSSLTLQGAITADGSFSVRYVPPGNYTLAISGASTRVANAFRGRGGDDSSSTPVVSFQPLSQPIVVTDADLSGFTATLVPVQTKQ
jgi:hypothetical protein